MSNFSIGVDLGGTNVRVALVDPDGTIGRNIDLSRVLGAVERTRLRVGFSFGEPRGVAVRSFEQGAFEIARDLDVHGRTEGRLHVAGRVHTLPKRARDNIIGVGRNDESFDI